MLSRSLLLLATCISLPAMAQWKLDAQKSSLNFVTTKNAQVTEVHSFKSLSGSISDDGKVSVVVPLDSVSTNIDLRDTRMKEMLFETGTYPEASFTAELPQYMLETDPGITMHTEVKGEINLHGIEAPVAFKVSVTKLADQTLVVSTSAPTVISAETFGLKGGVDALQTVAGLSSITLAVPVTFSVTFDNE